MVRGRKVSGKRETRRPSPAAQAAGGQVIPWWRTLKSNGELNEKYPGGVENQKKLLEKEGHKIIQKGKSFSLLILKNPPLFDSNQSHVR